MTDHLRDTHGTGHDADVVHRFTYHAPTEPLLPETYRLIRDAGLWLATLLESATPPSREQSLAWTHIEQAVMWANAAIARRGLAAGAEQGADRLADQAWARVAEAREEHGHHLWGTHNQVVFHEPIEVNEPSWVHFNAVCPHCPRAYAVQGRGAHRDAQEWLANHLATDHAPVDADAGADETAATEAPRYELSEPLMIRLSDPPEVINPQVLGGRGVLMLPPEVSFVPFMPDTAEPAAATDDPWANPAVGEVMLGIRARLRELTRVVNRFMSGLPGEDR